MSTTAATSRYMVAFWVWETWRRERDGTLHRHAGIPDGAITFWAPSDAEAIETGRYLAPAASTWVITNVGRHNAPALARETWPLLPKRIVEATPAPPVWVASAAARLVDVAREYRATYGEGVRLPSLAEARAAIRQGPEGLYALGLPRGHGLWPEITAGCY